MYVCTCMYVHTYMYVSILKKCSFLGFKTSAVFLGLWALRTFQKQCIQFLKSYKTLSHRLRSGVASYIYTLQRTNTENLKQIFQEKDFARLHSQFPYSYVCEQFIYSHDLHNLLQEICGSILEIYNSIIDTWMWKLGLRPRNSQKRNA